MTFTTAQASNHCGALLRRWRELRHLTQLDLALDAGVSARHISFLETGRTQPGRSMLLMLANALDIPLRERNLLFLAAGYAPPYTELALDDARMAEVRTALELILRQHEPYSGLACDRYWNPIMANAAYITFLQYTLGARAAALAPLTVLPTPRLNVLRLVFDPQALRPFIVNWSEVAQAMLAQVQRAATWTSDPAMHALIASLLAYPGVPSQWREPDLTAPGALMLPCELTALGAGANARMFSTVTTLQGPQDITLQDLHIEAFYPADAATAALEFYR